MIILEQVNLVELPERLLLLKLPAETRLTVTVEDSNTVQPHWDKSTVLAAMNRLKGSGNGKLVIALLEARKREQRVK
ncbi:MAG: hypothetical protein HC877_12595 [Thioploca sp.]|nr:hypothetical protein [Thioploca sp.]